MGKDKMRIRVRPSVKTRVPHKPTKAIESKKRKKLEDQKDKEFGMLCRQLLGVNLDDLEEEELR